MMITKIKAALNSANINEHSNIAVAFSGGCDSTALLHALNELKNEIGFELMAIHVNHCIRGKEAYKDAEFAASFCKSLGIKYDVHTRDVLAECENVNESTELCARRIRYEIFDEYVAKGYIVATAHTASDNTETVLYNLTRGSGIKGLCGIPLLRTGYIRPILYCSREDTEKYCHLNNILYVTDSTNLTDDYTRNFIRHNVIPNLKKINPSIDSSVASMTVQLTEIDEMLNRLTDSAYDDCLISDNVFSRSKLSELDNPILSKLVRRQIAKLAGISADNNITKRVCSLIKNGGKAQIIGNYYVCATKNKVIFYSEIEKSDFYHPFKTGVFLFSNIKLNITLTHVVNNLLMHQAIDYDKIVGKAIIRPRKSGDYIKLIRRPTKQIRKLMNEFEVPPYIRDSIPIIADDEGVIFVPFIGVAQRVAADENSKKLFIVKVEGNDND